MTRALRARRSRRSTVRRSLLLLAAIGLAESGCILFEDPTTIEGVDGLLGVDTTGDTDDPDTADGTGPGDVDGVDNDVELCSESNARSCGSQCVDCLALPAVEDASCQSGACVVTMCATGFANCNGQASDGCEQAETDRACGVQCQDCTGRPNVSQGVCVSGACELTCLGNFVDCDGQSANGCEQAQDLNHCGPACLDCAALPGTASTSCAGGACTIGECAWGFVDCDGDVENGCEQPLDDTQCGPACGMNCTSLPGVSKGKCTGTACVILECAPGMRDADGDASTGCEASCALGECWSELPEPFLVLAAQPQDPVALAGAARGVVYYTDDGGEHWYRRQTALTSTLTALARGVNLVAALGAGETNRLTVSRDQGLTWEAVLLPVSTGSGALHAVAIDGGRIVLGGDGRLLVSQDGGRSWENITSRVPSNTNVRALLVDGSLMMVASSTGALYRSTDSGATFAEVGSPSPGNEIRILARDGSTFYAVGNGVAQQSTDQGLSWSAIPGLDTSRDWRSLSASGGMLALVAGNTYVLRRAAGEDFSDVTLRETNVAQLESLTGAWLLDGEAVLVGHQSGFGHTFRTDATADDANDPYVRLDLAHEDIEMNWVVEAGDVLLAGGGASAPQLLRSADDGETWAAVEVPVASTLTLPALPSPDHGVIAGTGGRAIRSLNTAAADWQIVFPGLTTYDFRDIAFDPTHNLIVLTGVWSGAPTIFVGRVQTTSAADAVWNPQVCGAGTVACSLDRAAVYVQHVSLAGTSAVVATDGAELLRADNLGDADAGGGTWLPLPDVTTDRIDGLEYDGQRVVFFTDNGAVSRIWYSADRGESWPSAADPLVEGPVFDGTGDLSSDPPVPTVRLRAWAWDGSTGVAVGNNTTLVRTTDNGATWTQLLLGETSLPRVNLEHVVVSGQHIVAVGPDVLSGAATVLFSEDGGQTFGSTVLDLRGFPVGGLSLDDGRVLLVAPHGQVLQSWRGAP